MTKVVIRPGLSIRQIATSQAGGAAKDYECNPSCNTDHGAVSAGRDDCARNAGVEGKPKILRIAAKLLHSNISWFVMTQELLRLESGASNPIGSELRLIRTKPD